MASDTYHEPYELLSPRTRDMHRAVVTLIEELEAIDWYQQRADACGDEELRAVLVHNKNEEIEHAMMTLEWLRRASAEFDANVRTYLLSQGPITEIEKEVEVATGGLEPGLTAPALPDVARGAGAPPRQAAPRGASAGLGIGGLKKG